MKPITLCAILKTTLIFKRSKEHLQNCIPIEKGDKAGLGCTFGEWRGLVDSGWMGSKYNAYKDETAKELIQYSLLNY